MKMRALFFALLLSFGCSPTDIVVGLVQDGSVDADGDEPNGTADCHADTDCDGGYCNKWTCDADAGGTCSVPPPDCFNVEARFEPVCGCDGVTYWNPCVLKYFGASLRDGNGPCNGKVAQDCSFGGNADCRLPSAMRCAIRLAYPSAANGQPEPPLCSTHVESANCWALPPDGCDGASGDVVVSCPNPPGSGAPVCTDLCTAIRTQGAYQPPDTTTCADAGP